MGVAYNMNIESGASSSGRKSPHTLSKEEVTNKYGPFFQESIVMAEYAHLVQSPVSGVYVLPSTISPLMWYGIMIIQTGLYDGGVFKFTLSIPINYPDGGCPRIDFQSGVFHPQIDFYTGELETKKPFPRWRREVNYLRDLLSYARNIFLTIDMLSPLNEEAVKLYNDNFEDYKEKVKSSIQSCKESVLDTDLNDPHSIEISSWHTDVMRAARQEIFEPEFKQEESSSSVLSLGLSWIKKGTHQPFSKEDTH